VPQQSRAATGVRLQRLDAGDRLAEVVLVPPALEEEDEEQDAVPDAGPDTAAVAETVEGAGPAEGGAEDVAAEDAAAEESGS
jgi:DNA gyrase subunit A